MASISEEIREARLRWEGHVERKTEEDVGIRTWKMEVGGKRKIGRPKLRWSDVTRKDMTDKQGMKLRSRNGGMTVNYIPNETNLLFA